MKTIVKIYTFSYVREIQDKYYTKNEDAITTGGFPPYIEYGNEELVYQTDSWEDAMLAIEENRTDLIEARKISCRVVEQHLGAYHGESLREKFFRSVDSNTWKEVEIT